jgi:hypothetical protein
MTATRATCRRMPGGLTAQSNRRESGRTPRPYGCCARHDLGPVRGTSFVGGACALAVLRRRIRDYAAAYARRSDRECA